MSGAEYFSATVPEADRRFEAAAARARARFERIPHPLLGPAGEPLALSVAAIGPASASNALVISSGIHGVEGFAGAAIQTGLLTGSDPLPADTRLVLVHAVNPWGMAWNRREDHENIDVFRNLLYWRRPIIPDPLYDEIDTALDLAHWPDARERIDAQRMKLVAEHGLPRLIAAVRRGQHHRPDGLTYHGQGQCWSALTLQHVADRWLSGAKRIAWIDVHTGFGEPGGALVMSYETRGNPADQRLDAWFDGAIYRPGEDADIPPHEARPFGWVEEHVPGSTVTALILEFGTEPPEVTRDLFPASTHYHRYGDPRSLQARAVDVRVRRFCYPERHEWKKSVWAHGAAVARRTARGLAAWAAETP
ncbi:MAG: DUF2817 domain-containing protein [Gemmatimonadota bacterium]